MSQSKSGDEGTQRNKPIEPEVERPEAADEHRQRLTADDSISNTHIRIIAGACDATNPNPNAPGEIDQVDGRRSPRFRTLCLLLPAQGPYSEHPCTVVVNVNVERVYS